MYVCNYVHARRDELSTVYVCRRTARRAGCVSTQDARRRRPETHEMHRRHRSVAELMPCKISDGRWTMQTEEQRCTSRLLVRKLLTEMKRNSNRCRLTLQRDRATPSTMLRAPQEQAVSADGVSPPAVRVKPAVPSSQSFPISAIVSLPPHGWLHESTDFTVTVSSPHVRVSFFVEFSLPFLFLVPRGRFNWLPVVFERTWIYHVVSQLNGNLRPLWISRSL